jgi:hypothetical protein
MKRRKNIMDEKILQMLEEMKLKIDKIDTIEQKIDAMGLQMDENTQLIRALKDSAEVNKAEHDKMMIDIAKIQGDIQSIKKDISKLEVVIGANCVDISYLKAIK